MPQEGFTTGSDVRLDFYDPNGGLIDSIGGIEDFDAKPMHKELEAHTLDGRDRFGKEYQGWTLDFGYNREDGRLDAYFAEDERLSRAGAPRGNVTITQTITERDGALTQYRFSGVSLQQNEPGKYQRGEKVSGRISGKAGRRDPVA